MAYAQKETHKEELEEFNKYKIVPIHKDVQEKTIQSIHNARIALTEGRNVLLSLKKIPDGSEVCQYLKNIENVQLTDVRYTKNGNIVSVEANMGTKPPVIVSMRVDDKSVQFALSDKEGKIREILSISDKVTLEKV